MVNGVRSWWTVRIGVATAAAGEAAAAGAATANVRTAAMPAPRAAPGSRDRVSSRRAIRFIPSLLWRPVIDRKGVTRGLLRGPTFRIGRPAQLGRGQRPRLAR